MESIEKFPLFCYTYKWQMLPFLCYEGSIHLFLTIGKTIWKGFLRSQLVACNKGPMQILLRKI